MAVPRPPAGTPRPSGRAALRHRLGPDAVRGIARSCGGEDGNGLDFDESANGHEGMDADESARRKMVAEQLTAQRGEEATLTCVRDVHGHAHDIGYRAAGGIERRFDAFEGSLGLLE